MRSTRFESHGIMRGLSTIFWIACVLSLMLMFLGLVPLWCVGKQGNFTMHVATCLGGLAVCCICLWLRCCWLFDVHHITATGRQLLFPDILIPSILVLGTTVGNWGLGDFAARSAVGGDACYAYRFFCHDWCAGRAASSRWIKLQVPTTGPV